MGLLGHTFCRFFWGAKGQLPASFVAEALQKQVFEIKVSKNQAAQIDVFTFPRKLAPKSKNDGPGDRKPEVFEGLGVQVGATGAAKSSLSDPERPLGRILCPIFPPWGRQRGSQNKDKQEK